MVTGALDVDRLVRDLRAAAEEYRGGTGALHTHTYYELLGMARAFGIIADWIEAGDYDLEPPFDIERATEELREWLEGRRDH